MCGFFGNLAVAGATPCIDADHAARLRDLLTRRGPDDAGLYAHRNVILAHRRLAVLDPDPRARQPMATPDGRFVLVYNGELYNDRALRAELQDRGVPAEGFKTECDTETVLHAFATWGTEAFSRLRGMYALAIFDNERQTLTMARDPLGVKPLYFACDGRELLFASEPGPILAHPMISVRPNLRMLSAYLTTIRTVLGCETLFEGLYALPPGHMAQCDLAGRTPMVRLVEFWRAPESLAPNVLTTDDSVAALREAMTDSVKAHLRSDVPTCALLSGGIDSSVIALLASDEHESLRTYCAGAEPEEHDDNADFACARLMAETLSTNHAERVISREDFAERWPWMVRELGVPLSTPNEVAIHAVAARLREDGCVVTLSGEGADELLAGYEPPMMSAWAFEQTVAQGAPRRGGRFQLESNAWIPLGAKRAVLAEPVMQALEGDASLLGFYDQTFEHAVQEAGPDADPLEAHLRFHRRVNLTGLLQRLDTATMLASVEGRTPFADAEITALASSFPMMSKFVPADTCEIDSSGAPVATLTQTKLALRRAFEQRLPARVLERPKASFPLPFQAWVADQARALRTSSFARAVFTTAAIETVAADPSQHWRLAWPMINVAMWGEQWWSE